MTADDLRRWRAEMCYTQAEAARALRVSLSAMQKYERKTGSLPAPLALACAAIKAGVPPYDGGPIAQPNAAVTPPGKVPALYCHNDEWLSLREWSKRTGIERETLRFRIKRGWPIEKALTTPVGPYFPRKEINDDGEVIE